MAWIAFDPIFREDVLEMERAQPRENFHSGFGFDASHLLQLSTNRFFQVNNKQPHPCRVFLVERDCYRKQPEEKETSLDRRPVSD